MQKGIGYAVGAYLLWGLFPVFWRQLQAVPALQLISHRVLWSCVFLGGMMLLSRRGLRAGAALSPRVLASYLAAALLIGSNWLIFIWAVNAGFIVQVSLGYFINPLVSVLLGILFLRERLAPWQWLPIAMATAGVLYLTLAHGGLPWISLALALTFATYGLVKKTAPLASLPGLALETGLLLPAALAYLAYVEHNGTAAFGHGDPRITALMVASGAVTILPLLLFAAAARRIPLAHIGVLQYIAPTMQFALGVLVYREPFSDQQLVGFSLVWLALFVFAAGGLVARRRRGRLPLDGAV